MSSARASFLPTPVSAFIDYLDGKTISDFDDSAENLLSILSSVLEIGVRQQYAEFLSIRMQRLEERNESASIRDMDVVNFLIAVFPSIGVVRRSGPIQTAFNSLTDASIDIIFGWLRAYQKSDLDALRDPSSPVSFFKIFSQSSVYSPLYSLLEGDCADIHNEDFAQKCDEIKDAILNDLIQYLRRISIEEARQRDSSPEGEVVSGGLNDQDLTTQAIQYTEWFLAWEDEFRGSALENLEVKLSLNVQALRTGRNDKTTMSRIIPIVQSSGTGKSRLAEQYTTGKMLD